MVGGKKGDHKTNKQVLSSWTAQLDLTAGKVTTSIPVSLLESREIANEKSFNFSTGLNVEVKAGHFVSRRRLDTMFHF